MVHVVSTPPELVLVRCFRPGLVQADALTSRGDLCKIACDMLIAEAQEEDDDDIHALVLARELVTGFDGERSGCFVG